MNPAGRKKKAVIAGAILFGGAVAGGSQPSWSGCGTLSGETAKALADYVRIKAGIPAEAPPEMAYAEPVGKSCCQAAHFRVTGRGGSDLVVFLSPDQKFLSRDLSDWRMEKVLSPGRGLPLEQQQQRISDAEFEQLTKGNGPVKGSPDAPIKIALFTDFQCPYCRQQAQILKTEFKDSELQIAFHHLPLQAHPWAKPAAELAACVARQSNDAFWDLHDAFYQKQNEIAPENEEGEIVPGVGFWRAALWSLAAGFEDQHLGPAKSGLIS